MLRRPIRTDNLIAPKVACLGICGKSTNCQGFHEL